MNILYFIIELILFLIDRASNIPPRYTFFSSNFAYVFIYLSIYSFIYVWYVVVLLLFVFVSIDRLTKNRIFLNLFNRNPTLGG